jgi:undecaprenyl diphosphate synthase
MDGNGRWAQARRLPRQAGHAAGIAAVRGVVEAASDIGLGYLTLYAFSTENWRRPPNEVTHLMGLFRHYFRVDIARLKADNVRVRIVGAREGLEPDIAAMIEEAETLTQANTGLNLTFAFNYGGREELAAAARDIARKVASKRLDSEAVTPEIFVQHLQTSALPDPDLVIRTSGERRVSNFLLWQAAYAEYVFIDTLWPDFGRRDLVAALEEFAGRERRFGGIGDSDPPVQAAGTKS